jgi:hypothetical protein
MKADQKKIDAREALIKRHDKKTSGKKVAPRKGADLPPSSEKSPEVEKNGKFGKSKSLVP